MLPVSRLQKPADGVFNYHRQISLQIPDDQSGILTLQTLLNTATTALPISPPTFLYTAAASAGTPQWTGTTPQDYLTTVTDFAPVRDHVNEAATPAADISSRERHYVISYAPFSQSPGGVYLWTSFTGPTDRHPTITEIQVGVHHSESPPSTPDVESFFTSLRKIDECDVPAPQDKPGPNWRLRLSPPDAAAAPAYSLPDVQPFAGIDRDQPRPDVATLGHAVNPLYKRQQELADAIKHTISDDLTPEAIGLAADLASTKRLVFQLADQPAAIREADLFLDEITIFSLEFPAPVRFIHARASTGTSTHRTGGVRRQTLPGSDSEDATTSPREAGTKESKGEPSLRTAEWIGSSTEGILWDRETCLTLLRTVRFSEGVFCPHCDQENVTKRGTGWNDSQTYECKNCGASFTALSATIFANRKLKLGEMFYIIRTMERLSPGQIASDLGRSHKAVVRFEKVVRTTNTEETDRLLSIIREHDFRPETGG